MRKNTTGTRTRGQSEAERNRKFSLTNDKTKSGVSPRVAVSEPRGGGGGGSDQSETFVARIMKQEVTDELTV